MNRKIKFRNYIYVYGSEYCDYIDEYEVAVEYNKQVFYEN